jgi:hypothetical protein
MQGVNLCTVPWADVFRDIKNAPDYAAAVATCVNHPKTALTPEEERIAYRDFQPAEPKPTNLVEVDFKNKRRKS